MERIFFTHILPKKNIAQYKLSFAACNFSFNLMSGKGFSRVISTLPVFVSGSLQDVESEDFELVYSSLRKRKGIGPKLAAIVEQFSVFRKIPSRTNVWLYNLGYLNFLFFILIRLFKPSVKLYVIELDFVPPKKTFSMEMLFLWLQNRADGMIKLASSSLFTCKNNESLAGVTPLDYNKVPRVEKIEKSFLVSGALYEYVSNLPMLLQTFSKLPDCTLHITGTGFDEAKIMEYCNKYPNIIYHGLIPFDKYIELLHSVVFQLSTRQPDYPDNECNFPSKVIEALLHNRIVISTIEYEQILGFKYFKVSDLQANFEQDIIGICKLSELDLLGYANQSVAVYNRFNPREWNRSMEKIEAKSL